ncbi:MAG: hypothetical protein QM770_10360 [Tepidisphaeraceae bacterium]
MRLLFQSIVVVLICCLTIARAAEAPAIEGEPAWTKTVDQFARSLAGEHDRDDLMKLFAKGATLRPFDRERTSSLDEMLGKLPGCTLVSAHAYLHPSVSAASDLIADARALGDSLPQSIRDQILLDDTSALRTADATVARWFTIALEADAGDPVALIALYNDGAADVAAGRVATNPRLYLLLVHGKTMQDGSMKIDHVLYGDLRQAAN